SRVSVSHRKAASPGRASDGTPGGTRSSTVASSRVDRNESVLPASAASNRLRSTSLAGWKLGSLGLGIGSATGAAWDCAGPGTDRPAGPENGIRTDARTVAEALIDV